MAPDPVKLPQLREMRGHMLQLLGTQSEDKNPPATHRIGQFASMNLILASFLDEFKALFKQPNEVTALADSVQVPEVAQAQPVSACGPSNDVTALAGSAPIPGVPAALNEETEGDGDSYDTGKLIRKLINSSDSSLDALSFPGSMKVNVSSSAVEEEQENVNNASPHGGEHGQEFFQGDRQDSSDEDGQPPDAQVVDLPLPASQQPKRKRKSLDKGRKPTKKGRTIPEVGARVQEVAPTDESGEVTEDQEEPKPRRLKIRVHLGKSVTMEYVSKFLVKIAPPSIVDLSGESDDEQVIKRNVNEMDEETKNRCLVLFFKFWRERWRKQQKSREKINDFVDAEAKCNDPDVSSG